MQPTFQEFQVSLQGATPPAGLSQALQSLWQAAKGDWHAAHVLAQAQNDAVGAWVHAYLHRVEGDPTNAAYWYERASKAVATVSLPEEWATITQALLKE